jgi:hypothetical protein
MAALTTVLHSYGHEASEWPQLYQQDPDFTTTYQLLGTGVTVTDFHIQDGLLCHLGHLCVPASEHAKLIWEAHYSRMAGHFGMEKTVVILQKHFYWPKLRQDVNKYIISCTACAISKPTIKKQGLYTPLPTPEKPWESISMDYMSGLPSTKQGNDCVFVVIDRFSKMAILTACKKNITRQILPRSSSNECGSILGYHRPSSPTRTTGSSTHFGRVSGHCWTPSSLNPLLSTPKQMTKHRSSIR